VTPALELQGVSKRYRRKGPLALDSVSLAIAEGARACLLGPNGAGKSTTIRLLLGALRPTDGRVWLLGADVDGPGYLAARRRTGVVPQGPGMYPDLSVAEYLALARRLYERGEVDRAVEQFGLGPHRDKMLAQLSGGFQRRVVLAAALLTEPELLLLDEPTVGLDPVATHEVHAALRAAMAGRTTLLCTHNLIEAEALCEEVVILRGGRIVLHDRIAALRGRARPRLRLSARQGAEPLRAAVVARGLAAEADQDGFSVLVDLDEPEAAAPDLLRELLATGLDVYLCRPERASLEALFLEAVRA
jgi:ABC-2 type transport system ATP-binding protein